MLYTFIRYSGPVWLPICECIFWFDVSVCYYCCCFCFLWKTVSNSVWSMCFLKLAWSTEKQRRKKKWMQKKNLCGAIYESSGVSFFVNNEYEKIRNDFVLFVRWKFLFIETHMEYVRQQIPSLPMRSCFFFCA